MTPDYQKTVSVNAAPDTVFDALTTVAGLGAWWTRVTGSGDAGGELRFFFSHPDPCVMRVDEATRPSVVRWTVTSCDFLPDWVGTRPAFTIVPVDGTTELRFRHHGLTAELECLVKFRYPRARRLIGAGPGRPGCRSACRRRIPRRRAGFR